MKLLLGTTKADYSKEGEATVPLSRGGGSRLCRVAVSFASCPDLHSFLRPC